MKIEEASLQEIDLFNLNPNSEETVNILINERQKEMFKQINIKQTGKFTISLEYDGNSNDNIIYLLIKVQYDESTSQYITSTEILTFINKDNKTYTRTLTLESGTYYIGFFNNKLNEEIEVNFKRLVTQSNPNVLVTDPDRVTEAGSQINIIEKDIDVFERSYRQNHITAGFTRLIYPNYNYGVSPSRLDYDWYTSNENIASITKYGTVLGRSVGTVKIMAVLKEDPSKVFIKEFNIIEDTGNGIVELQSTYTVKYVIDVDNNKFHLEIEKVLCPYPLVNSYTWNYYYDCHNSLINANMNKYGDITVNKKGCFILEGEYKTNTNYIIEIHIIIE